MLNKTNEELFVLRIQLFIMLQFSGSQYNASGHIENWWKPDTFEEYKKRAKCFQTTYANYSSNFHNITTKVRFSANNSQLYQPLHIF